MVFTHSIPERMLRQAGACGKMGSAFYAVMCERLAEEYRTGGALQSLLDRHERRSRVALRLLGAAHFRALTGAAPQLAKHFPSTGGDGNSAAASDAVGDDVRRNEAAYDNLLAREVQTNEVARAMPAAAAILAAAHEAALPVRIFEIGSSAGLILNFDRYRYSGEGWAWGDPGSELHLRHNGSGSPRHLDAELEVASREGCDLNPLDARSGLDANTLLGFVWPDQRERFGRLQAALALAREHPPAIARGDGLEWISRAARPQHGFLTIALHTVMTEHLRAPMRVNLADRMAALGSQAGTQAPFAWVRMEPADGSYQTAAMLWPSGRDVVIARSDGHAQNLRWSAA